MSGLQLAGLLNRQSQLIKDLALLAAAGSSVLRYGSGKPANALGKDGDVYRDTTTADEYQKVSGAYVLRMNLKGEPGKTPVPGQDYEDGQDGIDGADGNSTFAETYAPDDALGIDKDIWIYVNTTDKTASYFVKVAGKWRPVGSAVGGGTTPTTPVGDTQAPNLSFTAPASGASVPVGTALTLTATATDNVAVTAVRFLNGATGTVLGQGSKNGNVYTLPYTVATAGPLSLVAEASDAAGNTQTATVSITVQAATPTNQAPSVAITGSNTGTVGVSQSFQAIASDSDGTITKVELVDVSGAVLASDSTSPYVLDWTPTTAGTFKVRAKATDDDGATSFSSEVTVTVSAASTPSPVVPGSASASTYLDALGDSLTLSQENTNDGNKRYYESPRSGVRDYQASRVSWVETLSDVLPGNFDVKGFGFPGYSSTLVAQNDGVLRTKPSGVAQHWLLVMVGTNDVLLGSTAQQAINNITAALQKIRTDRPGAYIALQSILPVGNNDVDRNQRINTINAYFKPLVGQGLFEKYIDLRSMPCFADEAAMRNTAISYDLTHLTWLGYSGITAINKKAFTTDYAQAVVTMPEYIVPTIPQPTFVSADDAANTATFTTAGHAASSLVYSLDNGDSFTAVSASWITGGNITIPIGNVALAAGYVQLQKKYLRDGIAPSLLAKCTAAFTAAATAPADADATTYIAYQEGTGTSFTTAQKSAITTFFINIKAKALWDKITTAQLWTGGGAQYELNIKNPQGGVNTYAAAAFGASSVRSTKGILIKGSSAAFGGPGGVELNATAYQPTDFSMGLWTVDTAPGLLAMGGLGAQDLNPLYDDGQMYASNVGVPATSYNAPNPSLPGLSVMTGNADAVRLYHNGTQLLATSGPQVGMANNGLKLATWQNAFGFTFFGKGLSAVNVADLYTEVSAVMTAFGRGVSG